MMRFTPTIWFLVALGLVACESDGASSYLCDECADGGDCVGESCEPGCDCDDEWRPVCGADGETYENSCRLECAGVELATQGECVQGCLSDSDCGAGEFCLVASPDCSDAECRGECLRPACGCPTTYDPICGEDGVEYDNECLAKCSGAEIKATGPCDRCESMDGCDLACFAGFARNEDGCPRCECKPVCESDSDCVDGMVCDFEACEPSCPTCTDCGPACVSAPISCNCVPDEMQVCGADGTTYGSECEARCLGVEVAHPGECSPQCPPNEELCLLNCSWGLETDDFGCPVCSCYPAPQALCRDSRDCASEEWCNPSACAPSCENCADCFPACQPLGCECPERWEPVCDSKGWTYRNACEAECFSVDARAGECS